MTKLNIDKNIFSENIHEDITIDQKKALDATKKILDYFLSQNNIFKKSCLFQQKFKSISFDILYCGSNKTYEINKKYRQKDYPADIITFAIFADSEEKFIFDGEINLGEIIISLDKVYENSKEKSISFDEELYFLLSHGIMHLFGFDHQTEEEYTFIINAQNSALLNIRSIGHEVN